MKKTLMFGLLGIIVLLCTACPVVYGGNTNRITVSVSGSDNTITKEASSAGGVYRINFNGLYFTNNNVTIDIIPIDASEKAKVEVTYSEEFDNYGFDVDITNETISIRVNSDNNSGYDIDRFEMTIYAFFDEIVMIGGGGYETIVDASGIKDLKIRSNGSGQCKISSLENSSLNIQATGSTGITLSGTTKYADIDIRAPSGIDAKNLICDSADINISSPGDVEISVKNDLDIVISSHGTVRYYGSPIVNKKIIGRFGSVEQVSSTFPL